MLNIYSGRNRAMVDLSAGDIGNIPGWAESIEDLLAHEVVSKLSLGKLPKIDGERALRSEIALLIEHEYRWPTSPEQIVLTYGATEGLRLVFQAISKPSGAIACFIPSFPYWEIAGSIGRACVYLDLADFLGSPIPGRWASRLNGVSGLVLSHPNNPTGYMWSGNNFEIIAGICDDRKIPLVLDLVGAIFLRGENFLSLDLNREGVWLVESFSKRMGVPGLRFGWVRIPRLGKMPRVYRSGLPIGISSLISNFSMCLIGGRCKIENLIRNAILERRSLMNRTLGFSEELNKCGPFFCFEKNSCCDLGESIGGSFCRVGDVVGVGDEFLLPRFAVDRQSTRYFRISVAGVSAQDLDYWSTRSAFKSLTSWSPVL